MLLWAQHTPWLQDRQSLEGYRNTVGHAASSTNVMQGIEHWLSDSLAVGLPKPKLKVAVSQIDQVIEWAPTVKIRPILQHGST
jgi:hypothetical protein